MVGHKLKTTLLSTVAATAMVLGVGVSSASALTLEDAWQIDLTVLNGVGFTVDRDDIAAATAFSGLGPIRTNIDHITLQGVSTVTQDVSLGSALGEPFSDEGFLALTSTVVEPGGGIGSAMPLGNAMGLYFEFSGLTGTLLNNGNIQFDPGVGTIRLILDSDTDGDSSTGDILEVATFQIIAPSGGSDLNFFGGAGQTATIDISLMQLTELGAAPATSSIFKDSNGDGYALNDPDVIHLGNVNALLDPNFSPNPDNTGIDGMGNGQSIIHVQNGGQYNIATIPEPTSMAALGFGLMGLMGMTARRRRKAA